MSKKLDRRSFLRRVGATAGIGALGVITGTSAVRAQATDSDTGRNADPVGGGYSGVTDSDSGAYADDIGRGRGGGGGSDPGGSGSNCSDTDGGAYADPGGRGSNCSDSD